MSNPNLTQPTSLKVTDEPSIGMPFVSMRVEASKRFDIYQEFLQLHATLKLIVERINMPWYKRLYNWFLSPFRSRS